MSQPALITRTGSTKWTNKHQTVVGHPIDDFITVSRPNPPNPTILQDLIECTKALQQVVGQAIVAGKQLRAVGGEWSLSEAVATNGWLLWTQQLNQDRF